MTSGRTKKFDKNYDLESLSAQVNSFLAGYQCATGDSEKLRWPPLFIVGAPRSGTTLMLQYLASTGAFAFPTNLMSRFYGSLPFACQVQLMIADERFDYQGEFSDVSTTVKFDSKLGKTRGISQPSEFWYFWRRFFPLEVPERLSNKEMETVDSKQFVAELATMERLLERPVLMKAVLICFHIDLLHRIFNDAIFVHIKRDTVSNARSLLEARMSYFGNYEEWYSAKPPAYESLVTRAPCEQVIGQVLATNCEIERQLKALPRDQVIAVQYEDFCAAPSKLLKEIGTKYSAASYDIAPEKDTVRRFESRGLKDGDNTWEAELTRALATFEDFRL